MKNAQANGLDESWNLRLGDQFAKPYMQDLRGFLRQKFSRGTRIFPQKKEFFEAFNRTRFENVKVVIIGQDPYHGPGQAHGLCFSVKPGVAPPPSLQNIFREQKRDLGVEQPGHGFLISWALQGVLLLNATLSVEMGKPGSHQGRGWETFTDQAIQAISRDRDRVVFVLWGAYAQKKKSLIDLRKHLVLEAPHPSPLSAHRGFLGCGHFSKINKDLEAHQQEPIDWKLPTIEELREIGLLNA